MDFFTGSRSQFKLEKCLDFTQLSKSAKQHLKNVYACVTLTVLAACIGAGLFLVGSMRVLGLLPLIGSICSIVYLAMTRSDGMDFKRLGVLGVFGFCNGVSLGPLLEMVARVNPGIIVSALLYATLLFASLTLAALYTQKRSLLFLGGSLFAGLNILFLSSMLSMVFGVRLLGGLELYLGLAIFCGFVLFDTQMIIYRHDELHEKDFIWHSLDLFIDLVQIFVRLLIILTNKEEKKNNKRR